MNCNKFVLFNIYLHKSIRMNIFLKIYYSFFGNKIKVKCTYCLSDYYIPINDYDTQKEYYCSMNCILNSSSNKINL